MLSCLVAGHLVPVIYLLHKTETPSLILILALNMLQIIILHCHQFYLGVIYINKVIRSFWHLAILIHDKIPFSLFWGLLSKPTHINCQCWNVTLRMTHTVSHNSCYIIEKNVSSRFQLFTSKEWEEFWSEPAVNFPVHHCHCCMCWKVQPLVRTEFEPWPC